MSEHAYTSIHYFTTHRADVNDLSIRERLANAFAAMKEDFTRAYQAMLDNSADFVIRKLDL